MDVGGFGKGKGKGKDGKDKGKGKEAPPKTDKACFNCGKKGHLAKDCWSKPQGGKQQQNKAGKDAGGASKGKGKGKSKDAGALDEAPAAEPVGAANVDLCHAAEAVGGESAEAANGRWIALNVDTGAGGTVWPYTRAYSLAADYLATKVEGNSSRTFKTATGELVEGQGVYKLSGKDYWGN
eukprot:5760686-Amphidinium_carterae.1